MRQLLCILAIAVAACADRRPPADAPATDSVVTHPAPDTEMTPPPSPLQADSVMARDTAKSM